MAVPKKRTGQSAQGHRRSNWKATKPEVTKCSNCGEVVLTHTVCTACGYYKGKAVSIKSPDYVDSAEAKKPAKKAAAKTKAKKAEVEVEAKSKKQKAKGETETEVEVVETTEKEKKPKATKAVKSTEVVEVEDKVEEAEDKK